jgi:hypothetical protein
LLLQVNSSAALNSVWESMKSLRLLAQPWVGAIAVLAALAVPRVAHAEDSDETPRMGVASNGLRGFARTALPISPIELSVAGSAGYGFTESIDPIDGAHHRVNGVLSVGVAPLPFLSFALTLDGRIDLHPDDSELNPDPDDGEGGPYGGSVGDPRLLARIGHALNPDLSIGADLTIWFPGNQAPSYEPGATSADLRALFAYAPRQTGIRFLSAAGFRLDNSGASAPDTSRLRFGDRIAIGLSDSHAVLAALGVGYRFTELELFSELSADLLVGGKAPELLASPLRATLGARYDLSRAWAFEITSTASLSKRPEITATSPLVPIEPRVSALIGLRFNMGLSEPKDDFVAPDEPAKKEQPVNVEPATPTPAAHAVVSGVLTDDGGEPLPEVVLKIRDSSGEEREVITDAEGHYEIPAMPLGPATFEANAIGFEAQTWDAEVVADMPPLEAKKLVAKTTIGVLRGLIRSFASEPIEGAEVVAVETKSNKATRIESNAEGEVEVELPPGRYRVTIRASGFRPHTRNMKIAANNVAILNVDLREQ